MRPRASGRAALIPNSLIIGPRLAFIGLRVYRLAGRPGEGAEPQAA
jgi:hypothetical protein